MTDFKTSLELRREELFATYEVMDISYLRVELWEWIKAASTDQVWTFQGNPGTVLFLQTTFQKLIRYAWELLAEARDPLPVEPPAPPFSEQRIAEEKQYFRELDYLLTKYRGLVRRLTWRETEQPLDFLRRFFDFRSPEDWLALLQQWVEYSLRNYSPGETGLDPDLQAYELLDGLLEAIYLMENRPASNREHLDPMVRLIVEAVQPDLIFEVRDAHSSTTDLVIVLSDTRSSSRSSFIDNRPIVELATVKYPKLSCWLYAWGNFLDALQEGNLYLSTTCTPDTLIYSNGLRELPEPSPKLPEALEKARTLFASGMQRAETFYQQAGAMADRALALFMLQQSAEGVFRTVSLALGGQEKKSHQFRVLLQVTRRLAPALCAVFAADSPEEKRLLQLLEDAYVQVRYAADFQVSEQDFQSLHERVGKLLRTAHGLGF